MRIKSIIENNLNLILLISVIVGLFVPGIELIPNDVVTFLLAFMVLFLSSKVDISEVKDIKLSSVIVFYIIRFILLPIILFFIAESLIPKYSVGILLLALLPVGITTPLLVGNLKGNVTFALGLTIITSLLAPLVLPFIFMNIGIQHDLEIKGLFITLFLIIIAPLVLYYSFIAIKKELKPFFYNNSSFVSTLLLGIIISIVVSKQKDVFLNDISALLVVSLALLIMFLLFYLFGWFYPLKREQPSFLICNALSSGAINTALGINLALLYFSDDTIFFLVVSEFFWVVSIPLFNAMIKRVL